LLSTAAPTVDRSLSFRRRTRHAFRFWVVGVCVCVVRITLCRVLPCVGSALAEPACAGRCRPPFGGRGQRERGQLQRRGQDSHFFAVHRDIKKTPPLPVRALVCRRIFCCSDCHRSCTCSTSHLLRCRRRHATHPRSSLILTASACLSGGFIFSGNPPAQRALRRASESSSYRSSKFRGAWTPLACVGSGWRCMTHRYRFASFELALLSRFLSLPLSPSLSLSCLYLSALTNCHASCALALKVALSREERQPELDSVEGDLMGECILRTSLFASDKELLAPLRIGMLRQQLRHRRLNDGVRSHARSD
jgi:hypothetical protein